MSNLDELKKEANELGVDFNANIGETKLQEKIDTFLEAREQIELDKIEADREAAIAAKAKADAKEKESKSDSVDFAVSDQVNRKNHAKELASKRKAAAFKTKVITIVDNDQRINNQSTSCTVNCSNEHFDLGQAILPLGFPVEVKQGHISALKSVKIPQHMKDPHNSALSYHVMRPRYSISYEDNS